MATTPHVIRVLSGILGMSPAKFDRFLRELRAAEFLPTGPGGGGKNAHHFTAEDLTTVLQSVVSALPGDAAEACRIFGAMRRVLVDDNGAPVSKYGPTLADDLAAMLTQVAEHLRAGKKAKERGEDPGSWPPIPAYVVLNLSSPRAAKVHWHGYSHRHDLYVPEGPYSSPPGISRSTTLHRPAVMAAAELLADTLNHHEKLASANPPANENAGSPAREPAPARRINRSRTSETGPLTTPESMRVSVKTQAPLESRIGHSLCPQEMANDTERLRDPPLPC